MFTKASSKEQSLLQVLQREHKILLLTRADEEWGMQFMEASANWRIYRQIAGRSYFFNIPAQNEGYLWDDQKFYQNTDPVMLLQLFINSLFTAKKIRPIADFIKERFYIYLKLIVEWQQLTNQEQHDTDEYTE